MIIYEIGTGYTPIPAQIGAATEIIVEELTRAFIDKGCHASVIDRKADNRPETSFPVIEVPIPSLFSKTDVHLGIMHKLNRVVYSVCLAKTLKKQISQSKEKIVLHFHNQYNLFFFLHMVPPHLRKHCIIAYTNHSGIWSLDWNKIEKTIKKRYFQEAYCMKKADLVYILNEKTKKNAIRHLGINENRIIMISNGVNTDVYHPLDEKRKQEIKEKLNLAGKQVILQVGSVYENKGQLRALELLLPAMKKNPSLLYAYAGGITFEDYQKQIEAFTRENKIEKQVRYLGMLHPGKELNEIYNIALAIILPSQYEAFCLVAIEAIAAGLPVLTPIDSSFKYNESIKYSNENFCKVLENILTDCDLHSQYALNARKRAVEQYSWNIVAQDYLNSWNSNNSLK